MNIRDLHYLTTIARTGHFGKAAEMCHVSQSTLSIQIKKLENELGVTLFERSNKKVLLTDIGRTITDRAQALVHQAEEIKNIAKESRDPLAGKLTLGAFPTLAPYLFPLCMQQIKKDLPKIKLQLVEEKTATLIHLLLDGTLDAALIAAPLEESTLIGQELFTEDFYLAAPHDHALARKKSIHTRDIQQQTLLLLDEGHCLRAQALDFCHSAGIGESQKFRATSLETLRQMVRIGQALTLIPKLALEPDPHIKYLPFKDHPPGRTILLCYRKTSGRTIVFDRLATIIRAATKKPLAS